MHACMWAHAFMDTHIYSCVHTYMMLTRDSEELRPGREENRWDPPCPLTGKSQEVATSGVTQADVTGTSQGTNTRRHRGFGG